jgi:hypothetical protein
MGNIIFVAFYHSLSLGMSLFFYENNVPMLKFHTNYGIRLRVMMFNASFNNISVISWQSLLLLEETGENYRPVVNH